MKNNVKKCFILITLVALTSISVYSLSGTVVSVTGKVELQTATGWAPLQSGDSVESGLIISTGFRSQAVLQVAGSNIVVNQLTRLTLEQLTETNDSHNSEVFLDLGSIKADVQGAQNKRVGFVVNTPVATASVRGTVFTMSLNRLSVERGLIEYGGRKGNTVQVPAGNASTVGTSGKAQKPLVTKVNESLGIVDDADDDDILPSVTETSYEAVGNAKKSEITTTTVTVTYVGNDD